MNTQHDITVSGKPLNPPKPPAKPHMLLWIDTETTGISRTNAKLLEIGMIVTSMDGIEEHDRFICPVRPDHVSSTTSTPRCCACTSTTGSWTPSWKPNPKNSDTRTWPAT